MSKYCQVCFKFGALAILMSRLFMPVNHTCLSVGTFAGFDESQPTCQSGGKPRVIEKLKQDHGFNKLVHIGDGVTDMETCPPAVSIYNRGKISTYPAARGCLDLV